MGFFKRTTPKEEYERINRKAQLELAGRRGRTYLEYARKSLASGDIKNARSYAEEGMFLTGLCDYYVAVREELQDFLRTLPAAA